MRRHSYEILSDLPPEALYRAITDIENWPQWDDGIEALRLEGPANEGAEIALKPRGRNAMTVKVTAMEEPYRFADEAYLPLARMRTEHAFIEAPEGTILRMTVEIRGPLAGYWERALIRDFAGDAARQAQRFLAFAANGNDKKAAPTKLAPPFYTVC
jgi:hypothetical protein